jgi:hypothetical protein
MTQWLEDMFGRSSAIANDRCLQPPIGCGGPATEFEDERSRKEYSISGLCQDCQNLVFTPPADLENGPSEYDGP